MNGMSRRKKTNWKRWLFLFFIVVCLGLSLQFPVVGESIRNGVHNVFEPIEKGISKVGGGISGAFSSMGEVFTLKDENKVLKEENDRLHRELRQAQELQDENRRLTELLGYKKNHSDLILHPAQVVAREGSYQNFFMLLDQGTEAGIEKEMPVLDSRGLMGIVRESWSGGSKVQLINDSNFAVGALVRRSGSRANGVLEGNTDHPNTPRLINLSSDADVQIGDEIITSGLGGLYPKGLLIGQVVSIHKDEGGLLKAAWIEPAAQINKTEEVFVLTGMKTSGGQ